MTNTESNVVERLAGAAAAGSPLMVLTDGFDAVEAALASDANALFDALQGGAGRATGAPATLAASSFASAACDRNGHIVTADTRFLNWLGDPASLDHIMTSVKRDRPRVSAIANDRDGRPVAVAAGLYSIAMGWPLSAAVRTSLQSGKSCYAVVAFRADSGAWDRSAQAFGLTRSELALLMALSRTGNLRAASAAAGFAYQTGRKLVASAMRRVGVNRQSDLVRTLLGVVAGDIPRPVDPARVLSDVFPLTKRQAELAVAVANGATRSSAADRAGVSSETAKDALRVVFDSCGVSSVTDLSRLVAEVEALSGLVTACEVDVAVGLANEPLRLVNRSWAPGRIAVADYGPSHGAAVIVAHAMMNGRHLPRTLVTAMQIRGLRPISVERPGFGLTEWVGHDVVDSAVRDLADVLDALQLNHVHVLARGGIPAMLTAAMRMPHRVLGGVLAGPETPAAVDRQRSGVMGLGKRLVYDHPRFLEPLTRLLVARASAQVSWRLHRDSVRGSPADERLADDDAVMADLVRATRQASSGVQGFIHEVAAHSRGLQPPALECGARWTIVAGATDQTYDQRSAFDYWRGRLPGAEIELLLDGGRWLHASHPATLSAALIRVMERTRSN